MKERFHKLLGSIDALSLRERLFVLAAIIVVVGGVWEAALMQPLKSRERIATAQITSTKRHIDQLNKSIELAAQGISKGMPAKQERLRVLRSKVSASDKELRVFTSDLVDPAQMRSVLEDLIRRQKGLKLLSISNLKSQPLLDGGDGDERNESAGRGKSADAGKDSGEAPRLYRHGMVLQVEGGYLDALAYLRAVEQLPWHLFWARLQLDSSDYPQSKITIELDTLSLDQEWIGV